MTAGAIARIVDYQLDGDTVEFGLLYLLLVAVSVFEFVAVEWLYDPVDAAISIGPGGVMLVGSILGVTGFVVAPLLFVRLRGVAVPTRLPGRGAVTTAVLAVVAPLGILAVMAGVAHVLLQSTISGVTQGWYGSEVSVAFLVQMAILPALLTGIGYGLLFNGAVQGAIRERFDARSGIAVVAVIGGAYQLFHPEVGSRPVSLAFGLVLFGLVVLLGYVACLLVRFRDWTDGVREQLTHPQTMVLVLGIVTVASLLVDVAMGGTELTEVLLTGSWTAVFAVAAIGYERTRSIWVPMLSVAVFQLAIGLTQYAEFLYGFASAP